MSDKCVGRLNVVWQGKDSLNFVQRPNEPKPVHTARDGVEGRAWWGGRDRAGSRREQAGPRDTAVPRLALGPPGPTLP